MADNNIKDFTSTWITFALLFFSLLTFAGIFMGANNPNGLGDTEDNFLDIQGDLGSDLLQVEDDANKQLNISSLIESEDIELGSRVSASNSYSFFKSAKNTFPSAKKLIRLVFTGDIGEMISAVFFGLLGMVALFFIFKMGRRLF